MRKFTLAQQVTGALALLAAIAVVQTVSIVQVSSTNRELTEKLAHTDMPALLAVKDAQFAVAQVQQWLTDISATRGRDGLDDGFTQAAEYADKFRGLLATLNAWEGGSSVDNDELLRDFERYYETGQRMAHAYVDEGPDGGNKLMSDFDATAEKLIGGVDGLAVDIEESMAKDLLAEQDVAATLNTLVVTSAGALLLLIAVTGIIVRRGMLRLRTLVSAVDTLSGDSADLTTTMKISGGDEIADLARGVNALVAHLRGIMAGIKDAAAQVATASEQTSAITSESSRNVERQREETSAALEGMQQIAATGDELARETDSAASAASEARERAQEGEQVVDAARRSIERLAGEVNTAVTALDGLRSHTDAIGSVLNVIRAVAEQTNLLALNAAIEAARAGEQGRGFAVVADEVRTLASRTQGSTQEIQTMIERLQSAAAQAIEVMHGGRSQAESCVGEATRSGEYFRVIHESVLGISDMTSRIQTSLQQHGATVSRVQQRFSGIDAAAANAATASTQTAAASQELSRLAQQLHDNVAGYRT